MTVSTQSRTDGQILADALARDGVERAFCAYSRP